MGLHLIADTNKHFRMACPLEKTKQHQTQDMYRRRERQKLVSESPQKACAMVLPSCSDAATICAKSPFLRRAVSVANQLPADLEPVKGTRTLEANLLEPITKCPQIQSETARPNGQWPSSSSSSCIGSTKPFFTLSSTFKAALSKLYREGGKQTITDGYLDLSCCVVEVKLHSFMPTLKEPMRFHGGGDEPSARQ